MTELNNVIALPTQRFMLACVKCNATMEAKCGCGVAYRPSERAAAALAANPNGSDRTLAKQAGVSRATVQRARNAGGSDEPSGTEMRDGEDGKRYPAKQKQKKTETESPPTSPTPPRSLGALQREFKDAITTLAVLASKPSEEFVGIAPDEDLEKAADFIESIVTAKLARLPARELRRERVAETKRPA